MVHRPRALPRPMWSIRGRIHAARWPPAPRVRARTSVWSGSGAAIQMLRLARERMRLTLLTWYRQPGALHRLVDPMTACGVDETRRAARWVRRASAHRAVRRRSVLGRLSRRVALRGYPAAWTRVAVRLCIPGGLGFLVHSGRRQLDCDWPRRAGRHVYSGLRLRLSRGRGLWRMR